MTVGELGSASPLETAGERPRRSRRRLVLLGLLSLLLVGSVWVWLTYLTTRQPITKVLPAPPPAIPKVQPRYLFSIGGLQEPMGVAVTPGGDRLYVAETGGERLIRAFDRDGKQLFSFAPPNTQAPGRAPVYLAVESTGLVYVADRMRRTVDTYDAGGNYKGALKAPFSEGWLPLSVRAAGDNIVVTELTEGRHRVLRLDKGGNPVSQFGRQGQGTGEDELSFPNSAVVDRRGRVYVSDSNNGRVQVFDALGKLLYTIPGFSLPRGSIIGDDQRLYVVDAVGHQVKVFDAAKERAEQLFALGDLGMGNGQFQYPNDVAVDNTDRVYVADRVNNRVQVWVY